MTKIEDPDEVQFRQVNPSWIEGDQPSRLAFIPTKKDDGRLSLDRSVSTTAKQSYDDFRALGLNSAGVFGITPTDCKENPNSIECFASPLSHNPHHSHAEFNGLTSSQKKAKSQDLRRRAIARGKLHP